MRAQRPARQMRMLRKMKTRNKVPMRQCTGCREMKNKKEMMRVLRTGDGEIVLDVTGRKNGRGASRRLNRQNKMMSLIRLATKAGKTASGEFSTEKSVKSGQAKLVVIASDASDNTKKKFSNMCTYYQVPFLIAGDKVSLGHCMGKEYRASLAVSDENFANAILKATKDSPN